MTPIFLVRAAPVYRSFDDVLDKPHDEANLAAVRAKVAMLTRDFPVYK